MTQSDEGASSSPLGLSIEAAQQVGKRLSEAREKRNVSVSELARKVKIREHFAHAIEKGDFASLPPGLNGRGLVRLYARELGVVIPELEPSAHLSESNARVERAEQALTDEVLRGQTIRSYPAGSVLPQFPHLRGDFSREPLERKPSSYALGGRRPRDLSASQNNRQSRFASPNLRYQDNHQASRGIREPESFPVIESKVSESRHSENLSVRSHSLSESVDDESPLDVVTPDIASVLGLDLAAHENTSAVLDELSRSTSLNMRQESLTHASKRENQGYSTSTSPLPPSNEVPEVSFDELIGGEPTQRIVKSKLQAKDHHEEQVISFDALAQAGEGEKNHHATGPIRGATGEFVVPVGSMTPETVPIENQNIEQSIESMSESVAQMAQQVTQPIPFGHADDTAHSYVHQLAHTAPEAVARGETLAATLEPYASLEMEHSMASAQSVHFQADSALPSRAKRNGSKYLKYFFGGVAAAATALLIFVLLPSTRTQNSKRIVELERPEEKSKKELLPEAEVGQSKAAVQPGPASQPENSVEVNPEPKLQQSPLAQGVPVNSNAAESVNKTSETVAEPSASDGAAVATDGAAQYGQGATSAELILDGMVDLQVRADGNQVVNGMQAAGKIILRFDKSCEIIASDGSLVRLNYAGWEHGALGHKGRRRRLILNSGSYNEASNASASVKSTVPAVSPTP